MPRSDSHRQSRRHTTCSLLQDWACNKADKPRQRQKSAHRQLRVDVVGIARTIWLSARSERPKQEDRLTALRLGHALVTSSRLSSPVGEDKVICSTFRQLL